MPETSVQRLSSGSFRCLKGGDCDVCKDDSASSVSDHSDRSDTAEHYWYRSGATFKGHVEDYQKTGRGIFTWPNGASYEGEYRENKRNGKGVEIWPDGSRYEGYFVDDLRHGEGQHTWPNAESFTGSFFHDRRHGAGSYSWPDNSSYTGSFYMDRKEGYGVFRLPNGNTFEGLYKEDVRLGPGVLTYPGGQQDVGVWHGERLIKLCTAVAGAFSVTQHPELHCNFDEHVTYLEDEHTPQDKEIETESETDVARKLVHFYNDTLDARSYAINREVFDQEFFKDGKKSKPKKDSQPEKIAVWNKSPFLVQTQRHILKHQFKQGSVSFDVKRILNGDRSKHRPKGELEIASERLLIASMAGNHKAVLNLLDQGRVDVNVSDKNGHTALIGAVVNVHIPIINTLLDYGADVNRLTDEGCSALAALCVYYYPVESFLYNVAETYLTKPEGEGENGDTERDPKEILSDTRTDEQTDDDGKVCSSIALEEELAGLVGSQTPVVVKSTCDSKFSLDSGFPTSAMRSELSSEMKKASSNPSQVSTNTEGKKNGNTLHPSLKDEDRDSALESEDEYAASSCDILCPEDFESGNSVRNYPIEVTDSILERCATDLSQNEQVVSGRRSRDANSAAEGRARFMAIQISERELMKKTLDLLLRRGANPSVASVPMPVLFFAIKAADVEVVKTLLQKGANTSDRLTPQRGGLAPLHIAAAIPGIEGVQITELLLEAQTDPNVRAATDDTFLNRFLEEEWSKDVIGEQEQAVLGGRTPLHIACSRDDNYKNACRVVRLLLQYEAKPDLLCNGFSPLALAVTSGNDMAIDELLSHGADPSLRLTHGVGSALCVASSTEYEHRRTIVQRLAVIDKLIKVGADVMSPIPVGPKRLQGTAVDYAYYMFNQDRVIAHMPYHALTYAERDTYNSRRKLLVHLGSMLRRKAVDMEKQRRDRSASPDSRTRSPTHSARSGQGDGRVTFKSSSNKKRQERIIALIRESQASLEDAVLQSIPARPVRSALSMHRPRPQMNRKPAFKYCYECGRSVGVRLTACTRCREVYYCSKACKLKAWSSRHKQECVCITGLVGRSGSPKRGRSASPTPKTVAGQSSMDQKQAKDKARKDKQTKDKQPFKITVPWKGRSKSAKVVRQKVFVDRDGHRISSADALKLTDAKLVYVDNYSFV